MEGGAWWAAVHGVVKSLTRLSDFTSPHDQTMEYYMASKSRERPKYRERSPEQNWKFMYKMGLPSWLSGKESSCQEMRVLSLGWEDPLEKEMATPSSILAWIIPWTEEPGRLQSMESQRVGHDSDFTFTFHI